MVKRSIMLMFLAISATGMVLLTGCETDAQNTALLGTAIGAGVGALAGGDTEGALIGAAVGGGAGYVVGNESDKQKTREEIADVRAEQNIVTVWITNSNGSKIPVKLTKTGPGYRGERGEYYENMPSQEDLKMIYGF